MTIRRKFRCALKIQDWTRRVLDDLEASERIVSQAVVSLWLIGEALEQLEFQIASHVVCAIEEHVRLLSARREQLTQAMNRPEKNITQRQNLLHGTR